MEELEFAVMIDASKIAPAYDILVRLADEEAISVATLTPYIPGPGYYVYPNEGIAPDWILTLTKEKSYASVQDFAKAIRKTLVSPKYGA